MILQQSRKRTEIKNWLIWIFVSVSQIFKGFAARHQSIWQVVRKTFLFAKSFKLNARARIPKINNFSFSIGMQVPKKRS